MSTKLWSSSLCNFLDSPVTASLFSPNVLLVTLFSNTLSLMAKQKQMVILPNSIDRFLPQKPMAVQTVKSPTFYGSRRFSTKWEFRFSRRRVWRWQSSGHRAISQNVAIFMFTWSHHRSIFWSIWIQSTLSNSVALRFILILIVLVFSVELPRGFADTDVATSVSEVRTAYISLHVHKVLQPRRPTSTSSPPLEPKNSHFNIMQSMPRSTGWPLPFMFCNQTFVRTSIFNFPHARHMHRLCYPSGFDYPNS
jgi:hypothetical protein